MGRSVLWTTPNFGDTPQRNLALLGDLRELYVNNTASLVREYGEHSLHQESAETLYRKNLARTAPIRVESVRTSPHVPSSVRTTISKFRSARPHESVWRGRIETTIGKVRSRLMSGQSSNVSVSDFMAKYRAYAEDVFSRLPAAQEGILTPDQRSWLTANESAITERID